MIPPLPGLLQGFFFLDEMAKPLDFLTGIVVVIGPATGQFWTE